MVLLGWLRTRDGLGLHKSIHRRSVTMAQCTRAFVRGEDFGFSGSEEAPQAGYA